MSHRHRRTRLPMPCLLWRRRATKLGAALRHERSLRRATACCLPHSCIAHSGMCLGFRAICHAMGSSTIVATVTERSSSSHCGLARCRVGVGEPLSCRIVTLGAPPSIRRLLSRRQFVLSEPLCKVLLVVDCTWPMDCEVVMHQLKSLWPR